jgi:predicted site-specific integrase-resolvase
MDGKEKYINGKKAREIACVTSKTLRVWDSENKIRTVRTSSGQRRYNLEDIQNTRGSLPAPREQKKICYARVSSQKQIDDLRRQEDFFKSKFPTYDVVTDIGSGINWKRKGLQTILEQVMRRNVSEIVVAHRDRLCRFAFELLESIFSKCNVKLVVLDQENEKSEDNELADDILSIIHVYSCRKMGRRRYKAKGDSQDKKDSTSTDERPEDVIEEMDGDEEICV